MEAGQTSTGRAVATRVKWAAALGINLEIQDAVEVGFEDSLETAEDEFSAWGGINERAEVLGN